MGGCGVQSSGPRPAGDSLAPQDDGNPCGTDYEILRRNLGRTGEGVSIFGIGGQRMSAADAPQILRAALDAGVNYLDTCRTYGVSEASWGPVVAERRNEVFLVSSCDARTRDGILADLDASLAALQTDYVDAYLLHALCRSPATEVTDGAIDAFETAKADGRIRFSGFSPHADDSTIMGYLDRYDFDIIRLFTTMSADVDYVSPLANARVRDRLLERNMGVLGMKVFTNGGIFAEFPDKTVADFLGYVWDSFPIHSALVGVKTTRELDDDIAAARDYTRSLFPQ